MVTKVLCFVLLIIWTIKFIANCFFNIGEDVPSAVLMTISIVVLIITAIDILKND